MPYASINGIELYYEVHGSGPALLFGHGQGGNHLSWWQQIPVFSKHYTCITFDHRAFGFSRDLDGKGRMAFSADVIGLLDHLDVQDVRFVAHSMGGRSGIAVALRTDRCKALVLAGTNGGVTDEAVRAGQLAAAEARGGRGLGAFSVLPSFKTEHPEKYFLLRQIAGINPPRARDFLHPRPDQPRNPANRGSTAERLAASGIPVLFLAGEHDLITPPSVLEQCHKIVPGSRYVIVEGSGHSAYFEKPDFFNQTVLSFLLEADAAAMPD